MSGYVRDIIVKRQFQNDKVTVVLKPMSFREALKLKAADTSKLNALEMAPLIDEMQKAVTKLDGLKADDASDVTIDELFSSAYFIGLLTSILEEWIEKATPANP